MCRKLWIVHTMGLRRGVTASLIQTVAMVALLVSRPHRAVFALILPACNLAYSLDCLPVCRQSR